VTPANVCDGGIWQRDLPGGSHETIIRRAGYTQTSVALIPSENQLQSQLRRARATDFDTAD